MILALVSVSFVIGAALDFNIPVCNTYGKMTIIEGNETVISCVDFPENVTVQWSVIDKNSNNRSLGTCGNFTTSLNNSDFRIEQDLDNMCTLRILRNHRAMVGTIIRCSEENDGASADCVIETVEFPANIDGCRLQTNSEDWKVFGICDVTKVFSSNNVYSCQWYRKREEMNSPDFLVGRLNLSDFYDSTGQVYKNGTCSMETDLGEAGNETFSIFATSMSSPMFVGTINIDFPEEPETNCPMYVTEGRNLSCDCLPNSSRPGNPPPVLTWSWLNDSHLQIDRVQLQDDGQNFTCRLTWGRNQTFVLETQYTIQIEYYPEEPETNCPVYVIEGRSLSCDCLPNSSRPGNPTPFLTWVGLNSSHLQIDHFQSGDGQNFTCKLTWGPNQTFEKETQYTIQIAYPPKSYPIITGHNTSQLLSVGSTVVISCSASGGKPPVSSVNLFCGKYQSHSDVIMHKSENMTQITVTCNLTMNNVTSTDNGTICTCRAIWDPDPDLPTLKTSITLLVANEIDGSSKEGTQSAAIIGGVVGAALFVIIVIATVIIFIKICNKSSDTRTDEITNDDVDNVVIELFNTLYEPQTYHSISRCSSDVSVTLSTAEVNSQTKGGGNSNETPLRQGDNLIKPTSARKLKADDVSPRSLCDDVSMGVSDENICATRRDREKSAYANFTAHLHPNEYSNLDCSKRKQTVQDDRSTANKTPQPQHALLISTIPDDVKVPTDDCSNSSESNARRDSGVCTSHLAVTSLPDQFRKTTGALSEASYFGSKSETENQVSVVTGNVSETRGSNGVYEVVDTQLSPGQLHNSEQRADLADDTDYNHLRMSTRQHLPDIHDPLYSHISVESNESVKIIG